MPNNIKNRLRFEGDEKEIERLVADFSTHYPATKRETSDGKSWIMVDQNGGFIGWMKKDTGVFYHRGAQGLEELDLPDGATAKITPAWTRFPDFEKVFPVPKEIEEVGQISCKIEMLVKNAYDTPVNTHHLIGSLEKHNRSQVTPAGLTDIEIDQFAKACLAYDKTGFIYWYDWNNYHWGTKWNSYSNEKKDDGFYFETAWSGVPDIIKEISRLHPSVTIFYDFSDEDTGYNTGRYKFIGGVAVTEHLPAGGSNEAFELAIELRPEVLEYLENIDGVWRYKEED